MYMMYICDDSNLHSCNYGLVWATSNWISTNMYILYPSCLFSRQFFFTFFTFSSCLIAFSLLPMYFHFPMRQPTALFCSTNFFFLTFLLFFYIWYFFTMISFPFSFTLGYWTCYNIFPHITIHTVTHIFLALLCLISTTIQIQRI